jgi:hypothetical protein
VDEKNREGKRWEGNGGEEMRREYSTVQYSTVEKGSDGRRREQ